MVHIHAEHSSVCVNHHSPSAALLTLCPPLTPQAALKKYQTEHKGKGESLEKCQAELKKLRRKSQGSKHPSKYGDKEMQVSVGGPGGPGGLQPLLMASVRLVAAC